MPPEMERWEPNIVGGRYRELGSFGNLAHVAQGGGGVTGVASFCAGACVARFGTVWRAVGEAGGFLSGYFSEWEMVGSFGKSLVGWRECAREEWVERSRSWDGWTRCTPFFQSQLRDSEGSYCRLRLLDCNGGRLAGQGKSLDFVRIVDSVGHVH